MISVGIDVGGTNIKAVLCEVGGPVVYPVTIPTKAADGPEAVFEQINRAIDDCLEHNKTNEKVAGIGIGVPGSIDQKSGVVAYPPNLPGWTVVPLGSRLRERWNMPVHVDNDANCAALGEAWFGAGREFNSFVGLTLGTGVGSGIIIDRKVHTGDHGFGGEFGHVSIDYNGPLCGCGNRGCIEAYIGNSYLSAEAVRVLREVPESQLHRCAVETPGSMTPRMLSEAAGAGDQAAYELLRNAGRMLGYCVASVANLLDITTFIVGGGVSAAGAPLFEGIESAARERTLIVHRDNLMILPAALGNDAGMLGAAALAAL